MPDATWRLVAVMVAMVLAGGCGLGPPPRGYQLYPGAERPMAQVAWITGQIHSIDGRLASEYPPNLRASRAFELLPGRHTIVITGSEYPHAFRWLPEYTLEFEAKAGLIYLAWPGVDGSPPTLKEAVSQFRLANREWDLVGKPVGRVQDLPDSSEGQDRTWKIAVRSTSRIEPAVAARMFRSEGHGGGLAGLVIGTVFQSEVKTREERTLAGESIVVSSLLGRGEHERWVQGHWTVTRGYHLEVGVALQYLGPDGAVPAPRVWLLATGGLVMKMLAAVGVPRDSKLASDRAVLDWLLSGYDPETVVPDRVLGGRAAKVKPRRLSSGEHIGETVVRYYFKVPEGVFPDQLRLAIDDLAPLRLPPISRVY